MSFDPMNPTGRPRSTPIPDPDHPGPELPAPTPEQFLGEAPPTGYDPNAQFTAAQMGFANSSVSSLRRVMLILFFVVALSGVTAWFINKQVDDTTNTIIKNVTPIQQTLNTLEVPTFPVATVPPVAPTAAPVSSVPVSPVPVSTGAQDTTTLPTPPPTTLAVPPTSFPGGVNSLFEGGAARAVADQVELGMAGDPTQFVEIQLFAGYAVGIARDPANQSQLVGAEWTGGQIAPVTVTSSGGPSDLSPRVFSGGDVNWDAIERLVAFAPAVLNIADGTVTYVDVQRIGTGNPPPVVIDIYVEGASGKGYVEASASGDILSQH